MRVSYEPGISHNIRCYLWLAFAFYQHTPACLRQHLADLDRLTAATLPESYSSFHSLDFRYHGQVVACATAQDPRFTRYLVSARYAQCECPERSFCSLAWDDLPHCTGNIVSEYWAPLYLLWFSRHHGHREPLDVSEVSCLTVHVRQLSNVLAKSYSFRACLKQFLWHLSYQVHIAGIVSNITPRRYIIAKTDRGNSLLPLSRSSTDNGQAKYW